MPISPERGNATRQESESLLLRDTAEEQLAFAIQLFVDGDPETLDPATDARLDCAEGTVDAFRDLLLGEPLEVGQLDDFALLGREGYDSRLENLARVGEVEGFATGRAGLGSVAFEFLLEAAIECRAALHTADPVDRAIARRRADPRDKRPLFGVIGPGFLPDRGEDFAHDVLGVFIMVENFEGGGKNERRILLAQFVKRFVIARCHPAHQLSLCEAIG